MRSLNSDELRVIERFESTYPTNPLDARSYRVTYIAQGNFTICLVHDRHTDCLFAGAAKRRPDDDHRDCSGQLLSLRRAFESSVSVSIVGALKC